MGKRISVSRKLCKISIIAFSLWVLLPTLHTITHTYAPGLCMLLFSIGLLLDTESLKLHWKKWLLRGLAIAGFILAYTFVLDRGGDNKKAIIIQQLLFWFSVFFFGYLLDIGEKKLWKHLGLILLCAVVVTSLTTTMANVNGLMIRDWSGNPIPFSRSVSNGWTPPEQIMLFELIGIGGYGFIYGLVFTLPLFWCAAEKQKGWKKLLAALFMVLVLITIILSQFLFAIALAAIIMFIEVVALIARKISRNRLSTEKSLWISVIPLLFLLLLLPSLVNGIILLAQKTDFEFLRKHLGNLNNTLQSGLPGAWEALKAAYHEMKVNPPPETLPDGKWNDIGRLRLYMKSLTGFVRSPLTGSLVGGPVSNGIHSDILDSLSTCGLIGTAILSFFVYIGFAPCLRGIRKNANRGQIVLALIMFGFMTLINPVFSYAPISLLMMAGIFFAMKAGEISEESTDKLEAAK